MRRTFDTVLRRLRPGRAAITLTLLCGAGAVHAQDAFHTSPACWSEPRVFHSGAPAPQIASRVRLTRATAAPGAIATRSPNGAYRLWVEQPDTTRPGPWRARIVVDNERDRYVALDLADVAQPPQPRWLNEKLVFVRVAWGRVVSSDIIWDVEAHELVYHETANDGGIAFRQFQDSCDGECACDDRAGGVDASAEPVAAAASAPRAGATSAPYRGTLSSRLSAPADAGQSASSVFGARGNDDAGAPARPSNDAANPPRDALPRAASEITGSTAAPSTRDTPGRSATVAATAAADASRSVAPASTSGGRSTVRAPVPSSGPAPAAASAPAPPRPPVPPAESGAGTGAQEMGAAADATVDVAIVVDEAEPASPPASNLPPSRPAVGEPIGLLALPSVFGFGQGRPPEPGASPIEVFKRPEAGSKRVGAISRRTDAEYGEIGYEAGAVVVYDVQGDWYQVQLLRKGGSKKGRKGWVRDPDANHFYPHAELLENRFGYLNVNWNGELWSAPDATGRPRYVLPDTATAAGGRVEYAARIGESRMTDSGLWIKVALYRNAPCESGDQTIEHQGWVPAYSRAGKLALWFWSRGC